jgi:hypothetical protein
VTPVRGAKFHLLSPAMSHDMSHLVSRGGAPELSRCAAFLANFLHRKHATLRLDKDSTRSSYLI